MTPNLLKLADDLELDRGAYELRRSGKALRLSRIPMELLLLLVDRRGDLVTREEIVERLWGKDVFLDTDNSINAAIRKLRQILDDDPEQPQFIHTVTGRGYRFVAPVSEVRSAPKKPVKHLELRASNLPVSRTGFVGREKEAAAAGELLLRPDVRLVRVPGPGGIGKSHLAVEVAITLYEKFPGGTYFVSLSPLSDPGLIAAVIAQTLGIRGTGSQSPLEVLKESLRDSLGAPMLLLLDNFEHLLPAAPTVAELLVMGPNLKILVTLRAAMDWSYDLLNPAEQKLFRRLSVFVGGCNLEGVEAVCDTKGDLDLDLLDGMGSMVDKSLALQVPATGGEARFSMLETIREYAREKLEVSGEEAATKRAHAAYCLVWAEEAPAEQTGTRSAGLMGNFVAEHGNFRAALEWLTDTGDAEWGLRLGAALFRFWEAREYLT